MVIGALVLLLSSAASQPSVFAHLLSAEGALIPLHGPEFGFLSDTPALNSEMDSWTLNDRECGS